MTESRACTQSLLSVFALAPGLDAMTDSLPSSINRSFAIYVIDPSSFWRLPSLACPERLPVGEPLPLHIYLDLDRNFGNPPDEITRY